MTSRPCDYSAFTVSRLGVGVSVVVAVVVVVVMDYLQPHHSNFHPLNSSLNLIPAFRKYCDLSVQVSAALFMARMALT